MSSNIAQSAKDGSFAVRISGVTKRYLLYQRPVDRLLQMIWRHRGRYFQNLTVLEDINLEIRHGETVGIIGRNGAGKSTLLQIIAGTLQPSEGEVEVVGRVAPLIELGAGFNPEFSGRDNVIVYGRLLGMEQNEVKHKYDEIVRFADIGAYIDRPVKTYSSGMHARLAFAVAIHVDPKILIVDEILAVGDAPFQQKCLKRFYEIKESGCTILIVAHDQYLVRSLCDKAAYLKAGRLVAFGPAAEVTGLYLEDIEPASTVAEVVARPGDAADAAISASEQSDAEAEDAGQATATASIDIEAKPVPDAVRLETTTAPSHAYLDRLFRITDVQFMSDRGEAVETISSGDTVLLRMRFEALTSELPESISFVFNLYRHDGVYVCGTTTLMDGFPPHPSGRAGEVTVTFPKLPLLAGRYVWRVAINDHGGLLVHSEAKGACPFRVIDDFRSVGVVHLERRWNIVIEGRQ
jgi:ABC-type polysaccharide/polyol phosphate transport system ATPase subunit